MLFKISSFELDNETILRNIKANVKKETRQARIKTDIIEEGARDRPVDIIINYISNVSIQHMSTAVISLDGRENVSGKDVKVKIGYNFLRSRWNLSGTIGFKQVNEDAKTAVEIFALIKKLF